MTKSLKLHKFEKLIRSYGLYPARGTNHPKVVDAEGNRIMTYAVDDGEVKKCYVILFTKKMDELGIKQKKQRRCGNTS